MKQWCTVCSSYKEKVREKVCPNCAAMINYVHDEGDIIYEDKKIEEYLERIEDER